MRSSPRHASRWVLLDIAAHSAVAEKLLIVLRDGKKIVGTMRSFDQFSNIVLENAFERVIVGSKFGDVPLGLYVIRGDNMVLLGQMVRSALAPPLFPVHHAHRTIREHRTSLHVTSDRTRDRGILAPPAERSALRTRRGLT